MGMKKSRKLKKLKKSKRWKKWKRLRKLKKLTKRVMVQAKMESKRKVRRPQPRLAWLRRTWLRTKLRLGGRHHGVGYHL